MIEVKVRAIAINKKSIFLVRHQKGEHLALPGGKVEFGETINEAIVRELKEELDIDVKIGKLLFIHELIKNGRHLVEFFFYLENAEILDNVDNIKASHKNELEEFGYYEINNVSNIRPEFLKSELAELLVDNINERLPKIYSYRL